MTTVFEERNYVENVNISWLLPSYVIFNTQDFFSIKLKKTAKTVEGKPNVYIFLELKYVPRKNLNILNKYL
jgi:hypothetical protein